MIYQFITMSCGDLCLTLLDDFIVKLDDFVVIKTNHMIVMLIRGQLENRVTTLEVMPDHQAGSLELGQHPIDGREAHIVSVLEKRPIDILGTHVMLAAFHGLQHLQDLDSRQRYLQARLAQFMVLSRHDLLAALFARSNQVRYDCRPGHDNCSESLMQKFLWLILAFCLAACAEFPGVYRIDIQQGNIVTQDALKQLKAGMTTRQVRFVLGSPLIKDTFDTQRWTYIYSMQRGGEDRKQESLTLLFDESERLLSWSGDMLTAQVSEQ